MAQYIPKAALVAEIEKLQLCTMDEHMNYYSAEAQGEYNALSKLESFLDTLEVKEIGVDLGDPKGDRSEKHIIDTKTLEVKEVGVWKTVDNINHPQADKNKIYCVFTKDRHILATVINHPKDEELLQWKCTEFPFHRYDMCEGDKYMQIV